MLASVVLPLAALSENAVVSALLFTAMGLLLFGLAFFVIVKVSPFSIRKEIEDDQNTALGIIIGAVIIGIAMIISAAIQG
jgi:uncharacterized membrane protein YjfL (UPF0719 family)